MSLVGIPGLGAWNLHCPVSPLVHEIRVGIPDSGDPGTWGFRPVQWGFWVHTGVVCSEYLYVIHIYISITKNSLIRISAAGKVNKDFPILILELIYSLQSDYGCYCYRVL